MAAPRPLKLDATATEKAELFGPGLSALHIKNAGSTTVNLDFDRSISTDSYPLEAGEFLDFTFNSMVRLYYKTDSGTSTLRIIKSFQ